MKVRISKYITFILIAGFVATYFYFPLSEANENQKSDIIKAVSVIKILNYVDLESDKVNLCYVSDEFFSATLEKLNKGKKTLKKLNNTDIGKIQCNIVYISYDTDKEIIKKILKSYPHAVSISDVEDFIKYYSGIIEINENDGKTIFTINIKKSNDLELKLSSKLLEFAEKVY